MTYDDNYFWMDPKETKKILIRMDENPGKLKLWAWNSDVLELEC